ncbi:STAS domain-containing protein [Cellulomonas aerilata]|uniref:STAS domain-containing protein n=1 Tax=Cellulomonas aerilata TaxID=515326 RepID=UPI001FE26915|nr:STAS domain-containing protein [Cellulomonas aerilata]
MSAPWPTGRAPDPAAGGPSPAGGLRSGPPRWDESDHRPGPDPWAEALAITVATRDRVVIALAGEIDIANAGYLRAELAYLLEAGQTDVVVDLTHVVSISSSGLGVLVGALKRLRSVGGRLVLVAASDSLLRILRITRLNQVFEVHPTRDAALGR